MKENTGDGLNVVMATAVAFDGMLEATFRVDPWLLHASVEDLVQLIACGDDGEEYANALLANGAKYDAGAKALLTYVDRAQKRSLVPEDIAAFTCKMDIDEAMQFVKVNQPNIYWAVMMALGRAFQVQGKVVETISIEKSISAHVMVDEYLQETGQSSFDLERLVGSDWIEEKVREEAYAKTIFDNDHGWVPNEGATNVNVIAKVVIKAD